MTTGDTISIIILAVVVGFFMLLGSKHKNLALEYHVLSAQVTYYEENICDDCYVNLRSVAVE